LLYVNIDWIYSFADRDLMIRHRGGGIGHLQDVCSIDHDSEQNDMAAEDSTRPRGDSNVTVEFDSESEIDDDMGSGSEQGDDDVFEDEESDGYVTL
jgi:hypothetical protein